MQTYDAWFKRFHWVSALLILGLLVGGFLMPGVGGEVGKIRLYGCHVLLGIVLLGVTLARILRRSTRATPEALPMGRIHHFGMEAVHALLYVGLLILTGTGLGMLFLTELPQVLRTELGPIPDFSSLMPRRVHGFVARIYIALVLAHVAGVLRYQIFDGDTLARMGVRMSFRRFGGSVGGSVDTNDH
ncbi:MAG: cytochrome b [Vicinamibacteria bacterium]